MNIPLEIRKNVDGSFTVISGSKIIGSSVPPDELLSFIEEFEDEQIQR
jgi:hypothetical protein